MLCYFQGLKREGKSDSSIEQIVVAVIRTVP